MNSMMPNGDPVFSGSIFSSASIGASSAYSSSSAGVRFISRSLLIRPMMLNDDLPDVAAAEVLPTSSVVTPFSAAAVVGLDLDRRTMPIAVLTLTCTTLKTCPLMVVGLEVALESGLSNTFTRGRRCSWRYEAPNATPTIPAPIITRPVRAVMESPSIDAQPQMIVPNRANNPLTPSCTITNI